MSTVHDVLKELKAFLTGLFERETSFTFGELNANVQTKFTFDGMPDLNPIPAIWVRRVLEQLQSEGFINKDGGVYNSQLSFISKKAWIKRIEALATEENLDKVVEDVVPEHLRNDVTAHFKKAWGERPRIDLGTSVCITDGAEDHAGECGEIVKIDGIQVTVRKSDGVEIKVPKNWVSPKGSKKASDGYDRKGMPLRGHDYHYKTNEELRYIMKDASEAAKAMQDHDSAAEGKYLDQVNDAATVLHYRKMNGIVQPKPKPVDYIPNNPIRIEGKKAGYLDVDQLMERIPKILKVRGPMTLGEIVAQLNWKGQNNQDPEVLNALEELDLDEKVKKFGTRWRLIGSSSQKTSIAAANSKAFELLDELARALELTSMERQIKYGSEGIKLLVNRLREELQKD